MFKSFERWSWSMLMIYRKCPFWARLKYIDRRPEPKREDDDRRDRGIALHKNMQDFIVEKEPPLLDVILTPFDGLLLDVREAKQQGLAEVSVEEPMYFDQNWRPQKERDGYWFMIIPDLHVRTPELNLTVDGKSGKKHGNEVSHFGQIEFYCTCAWIHHPEHDLYNGELWYFDKKDVWPISFTVTQLEKARAKLDAEVQRMFADKIHQPRPSKMTCKYCPYNPRGTGDCPVGV